MIRNNYSLPLSGTQKKYLPTKNTKDDKPEIKNEQIGKLDPVNSSAEQNSRITANSEEELKQKVNEYIQSLKEYFIMSNGGKLGIDIEKVFDEINFDTLNLSAKKSKIVDLDTHTAQIIDYFVTKDEINNKIQQYLVNKSVEQYMNQWGSGWVTFNPSDAQ